MGKRKSLTMDSKNIIRTAESFIGICENQSTLTVDEIISAIGILVLDLAERSNNDVSSLMMFIEQQAVIFNDMAEGEKSFKVKIRGDK